MADGAWRCSQCGTVNEPVANACRTCGRWPSLFELEGSLVDAPPSAPVEERFPAELPEVEEAEEDPLEPEALPDPDVLVTDRHMGELPPEFEGEDSEDGETGQRSRWQVLARLIVPIGVVLYILVTALADR